MPPQMPMQGGMPPRMMNQGLGRMGQMGMNQMPRNQMMRPMMGRAQQLNRGGGGFLSKILGRGNQAGGTNGFMGMQQASRAASGSGSFLQSLSNPGGLSSILNNTQQVLKTAQSIGPMIQQYGPLVRNLPAIWKLYRGFKNATNETEEESKDTKEESKDTSKDKKSKVSSSAKSKKNDAKSTIESNDESSMKTSGKKVSSNVKRKKQSTAGSQTARTKKGASVPKLYI